MNKKISFVYVPNTNHNKMSDEAKEKLDKVVDYVIRNLLLEKTG